MTTPRIFTSLPSLFLYVFPWHEPSLPKAVCACRCARRVVLGSRLRSTHKNILRPKTLLYFNVWNNFEIFGTAYVTPDLSYD